LAHPKTFLFQYQLDVQYAVGRIHFATLDEYAAYARSVVVAERNGITLPRRIVFAGVQHPDDVATSRSLQGLVQPLATELVGHPQRGEWEISTLSGSNVTKERLSQLLSNAPPTLLFTASHGVEFEANDPHQLYHQGAILCADWPGPQAWRQRPIPPAFYLAADDIASNTSLHGAFVFQFACFGAGCPREDDFPHLRGTRSVIAAKPFVAALPRRLLSLPRGGALAYIGHVERAWTFSFSDTRGGRQIETFSSTLRRLLFAGAPIGYALEFFNERYAELATVLTEDIENARWGQAIDPIELSTRWTEHNDARSYIILGDPATRLCRQQATEATDSQLQMTMQPSSSTKIAPIATPSPIATESVATPPSSAAQPVTPVPAGSLPPETPVIPVALPEVGASFGLFGNKPTETMQKLSTALQEFGERLATTLQQVIADAAHLEVETYTTDAPETINYRQGDFRGASLRAVTRMSLDGDTQVLVPTNAEGIDERLWAIHVSMVQQAQTNRAEMVRAIATAAAGLLGVLQGK
jgi:hypothetical protein